MSPLPVIDNVFRVALETAPFDSVTAVNVMHYRCPGASVTDVRNGLVAAATDLPLYNGVPGDATPFRMTVTALDGLSASGEFPVPGTAFTSTSTDTAECVPEAAIVVKFGTDLRGQSHRGRIFLGPIAEASLNGPAVNSGTIDTLQDAWDEWQADLEDALTGLEQVVASYKLETAATITHYTVNPEPAIQRRRLIRTRS